MKKTRLFHTLVLVGASLTGGAVAATATVSVAMISGCDANDMLPGNYPDIGVPRDMGIPNDLSAVPDLLPPNDLTSQD